jgi:hypothetical protein
MQIYTLEPDCKRKSPEGGTIKFACFQRENMEAHGNYPAKLGIFSPLLASHESINDIQVRGMPRKIKFSFPRVRFRPDEFVRLEMCGILLASKKRPQASQ